MNEDRKRQAPDANVTLRQVLDHAKLTADSPLIRGALSRCRPGLGVAVCGEDVPVVVFPWPACLDSGVTLPPQELPFSARGSTRDTMFGFSVSLAYGFRTDGDLGQVFIPFGSPVCRQFCQTGRVVVVWAKDGVVRKAGVVGHENLADLLSRDASALAIIDDPDAAAALAFETDVLPLLPQHEVDAFDRLQVGWIRDYSDRLFHLLAEIAGLPARRGEPPDGLAPHAWHLLGLASSGTDRIRTCFNFVRETCGADLDELGKLVREVAWLLALHAAGFVSEETATLAMWVSDLLRVYLTSSWNTRCGRRVLWNDQESQTIVPVEPDPSGFPADFPPESYWTSLPHSPLAVGVIPEPGAVPARLQGTEGLEALCPTARHAEESRRFASELLREAGQRKRFTIPPGAVVELPAGLLGPFRWVELSEFEGDVGGLLRTAAWEFVPFVIDIENGALAVQSRDLLDSVGTDRFFQIGAGVACVLAAIVRDFWVLEEREAVFGFCGDAGPTVGGEASPGTGEGLGGYGMRPRRGRHYRYLARVRRAGREEIAECHRGLNLRSVRLHLVSGHLRRSRNASPGQIDLGRQFGLEVPGGHTFVRPHSRGGDPGGAGETVYRSRSATRLLYGLTAFPPADAGIDWLRFERVIHALVASLGLEFSGSAREHGSLYVMARREGQGCWLLLCKFLGAGAKAGPEAVRRFAERLGRLSPRPRGLVVTNGMFKPSAVAEAARLGIELVDGNELARLREERRTDGGSAAGEAGAAALAVPVVRSPAGP